MANRFLLLAWRLLCVDRAFCTSSGANSSGCTNAFLDVTRRVARPPMSAVTPKT